MKIKTNQKDLGEIVFFLKNAKLSKFIFQKNDSMKSTIFDVVSRIISSPFLYNSCQNK